MSNPTPQKIISDRQREKIIELITDEFGESPEKILSETVQDAIYHIGTIPDDDFYAFDVSKKTLLCRLNLMLRYLKVSRME